MSTSNVPPAVQLCLPSTHAVLPGAFTRHALQPNFYTHHPVEGSLPHPHAFDKPFVAHHRAFLDLLGPAPKVELIASTEVKHGGDGREAFHEAGVWIEETQEVWITSNLYRDPYRNEVSAIKVDGNEADRDVGRSWRTLTAAEAGHVVTGNGGTIYKIRGEDHVLFCSQGLGQEIPSALVVMNPRTGESWPILNNFHGRPFNSINDVVVLPGPAKTAGASNATTSQTSLHDDDQTTIWFTDVTYGYAQGYKPKPLLPNQVYCFHPASGTVRAVADGFDMCNGLCFNHEGTKMYVTDTGCVNAHEAVGRFSVDSSRGGGIYEFDVVRPPVGTDYSQEGPSLINRRLFAFSDGGAPDGIKTDTLGNVWTGTCDGVQCFNKFGTLIGKIAVFPDEVPDKFPSDKDEHRSRISANLCFLPGGKLFIMVEDRILLAHMDPNLQGSLLPH